MANKTTWAPGQSGNARGRPPKCRALTDLLTAAGRAKCVDADGNQIPRNKLLADMIWTALIAGQITFLAENRRPEEYRSKADEKIYQLKPDGWIAIFQWLFAQVDGDLIIKIDDSKTEDDAPADVGEVAPVLYLPDNGRSSKPDDDEPEAPGQKQAAQKGVAAPEPTESPPESGS